MQDGLVPESQIDQAARRIVRLMVRTGHLDGFQAPGGELCSDRHQAIARRAAEESFVLLKNDGGLAPLDAKVVKTVALIGPNAARLRIQGDGSSRVHSARKTTVLEALRARLGNSASVIFAEGCDNEPTPPPAEGRMFSPSLEPPTEVRGEHGLALEIFEAADFSGRADPADD